MSTAAKGYARLEELTNLDNVSEKPNQFECLCNFCLRAASTEHWGCVLQELTNSQEIAPSVVRSKKLTSELRLSFAALTSATIQGICAFLIAMNSIKLALGITSAATAGGGSFIHSDPVRLILRYVSAVLATATLYVIWNGWRLRHRREAQWRRLPLSRREKWMIAFGLFSAAASWFLIIAEVFAHQRVHPR